MPPDFARSPLGNSLVVFASRKAAPTGRMTASKSLTAHYSLSSSSQTVYFYMELETGLLGALYIVSPRSARATLDVRCMQNSKRIHFSIASSLFVGALLIAFIVFRENKIKSEEINHTNVRIARWNTFVRQIKLIEEYSKQYDDIEAIGKFYNLRNSSSSKKLGQYRMVHCKSNMDDLFKTEDNRLNIWCKRYYVFNEHEYLKFHVHVNQDSLIIDSGSISEKYYNTIIGSELKIGGNKKQEDYCNDFIFKDYYKIDDYSKRLNRMDIQTSIKEVRDFGSQLSPILLDSIKINIKINSLDEIESKQDTTPGHYCL